MRLSVREKILLITATIFLVTISVNTLVNNSQFRQEYAEAKKAELAAVSHSLKRQLDRLLELNIPVENLVGFDEICRELVDQNPVVHYAMVVAPDGNVLFHSDGDLGHDVDIDAGILRAADARQQEAALVTVDGAEFVDFYIPVFDAGGERVASVRTGFPAAVITDTANAIATRALQVTGLTVGIGLLLLFGLLKLWVGRPINRFIHGIKRITGRWSVDSERIRIDDGGEIGELAGAFNDMMDVLRQTSVSKNFVDGIVEHMLNGLVVCDRDDRVIRVNREALRLLGYTTGELVGQRARNLFPDNTCPGEADRDPTAGTARVKAFETNLRGRDGAEVPVLFSSSSMCDTGGEVTGRIFVLQDISEVRMLRGFLPICASCKKIRDDEGYWSQIEHYIADHTRAQFSHGICPECTVKLYPSSAAARRIRDEGGVGG